jgi:RHS repeat-associated protein
LPDTTTTKYTYDGVGRLLTTTDQAGLVTTKTYNAVGRLTSVADAIRPTANVTQYAYDLNGNLLQLQDAAGRVTSYEYDRLDRRIVRTLPLGNSENYSYDAVGNLATKNDFNQNTTTYSYDALNRLLSKVPDSDLSEPTISFTYTQTGQRASMTDATGTTNYSSYDNRDRLKTKATPEGTLSYTYDVHGNVLTIASSNTNGASMTYTYDALNRLASAKDNRIAAQGGPSTPTTYGYDAVGNPTAYAYPNTVQTGNVFDPLNRLTQTCASTSSPACSAGTKLASYAYTLGAAGNRTNVLELNGRNVAYGYDNDYRLTSEAITGDPAGHNGTVSYTQYDAVGNRLSMTSTLSAVPGGSFVYDANDQLTTDTYDANGNTISSGGISYGYDFENRLLTPGAVLILYDGDGNRVSETVAGVTTEYLVDTLNPTGLPQVVDEVVNGSVTRTYAYGLQRLSENQKISGTWTPSFYGYDGHGNVRFLANTSGTVGNTYQFDAFGNQITSTGTTPNNYLYSGEASDSATNFYQLRDRWYRPTVGRFITRDSFEGVQCSPLSFNPYIYGSDDPVNRIDPTGRADELDYSQALKIGVYAAPGLILLQKQIACVFSLTASVLYGIVQAGPGNVGRITLNSNTCTANVEPKCPPCDPGPEAGTLCYETGFGQHHGWDPHYHIWHRGQDQVTCDCYWNKKHGTKGGHQFPPVLWGIGLQDCSTYPSWLQWTGK